MLEHFKVGFNIGLWSSEIGIDSRISNFLQYDLMAGFCSAKYRMNLPEGWLQ